MEELWKRKQAACRRGIRTSCDLNYRKNLRTFDPDSVKYDEKGRQKAIYLGEEIAGFAVHLVQENPQN
ncbi:MAG: hypothetical protein VB055_10140 [Oscillospiraceae bacterium]|nr:hypothetical protein [Oscillospiraceae bacterium]